MSPVISTSETASSSPGPGQSPLYTILWMWWWGVPTSGFHRWYSCSNHRHLLCLLLLQSCLKLHPFVSADVCSCLGTHVMPSSFPFIIMKNNLINISSSFYLRLSPNIFTLYHKVICSLEKTPCGRFQKKNYIKLHASWFPELMFWWGLKKTCHKMGWISHSLLRNSVHRKHACLVFFS